MRAVNLLPPEHRRTGGSGGVSLRGPGVVVVGALALALGLVTFYVMTNNSVADQKSKLATLNQQVPQAQTMAARLGAYTQFSTLAQQRAQTVRQIASTRFDWAASMSDLSKVMPANTTLQSLSATAGTGVSAGGSSGSGSAASAGSAGGSGSGLRTALPNPAFELRGCTGSQDDVARLMSRLRLMNGVVRVTLGTAAKADSPGQGGGASSAASSSSAGSSAASSSGSGAGSACPNRASSFDIVVFFSGPAPSGSTPSTAGSQAPARPPGAPPSGTGQSVPTGSTS